MLPEGGPIAGVRIVLRSSRRKWLRFFVTGTVFTAGGIFIAIARHDSVGWFLIVFAGLCQLATGWQLIAPGRLIVTPTEIQIIALWRRYERDLVSCSEFHVWTMARQEMVVFDHPIDSQKVSARANRALSGYTGGLPDTFGMRALELAALLNRTRAAALSALEASIEAGTP